jgi:hypothetical protein
VPGGEYPAHNRLPGALGLWAVLVAKHQTVRRPPAGLRYHLPDNLGLPCVFPPTLSTFFAVANIV